MKNEQIKEAQETKKREAEKKKKEMEEQRQAELKRKLDTELAAQKTAGEVRRKFCLFRTLKHRNKGSKFKYSMSTFKLSFGHTSAFHLQGGNFPLEM